MARLLVINNDIDTMSLLQKWLQKKSHEVKYTGSEEEALQLIKNFKPEVILVDVLQGHIAEKIKADNEIKKVPIVLMTGYTITNQNQYVKKADDVIEKPFNLNLLEKKIEKFLQKTG